MQPDYGLKAVSLLIVGKTDSELLAALVAALSDNASDLIDKLLKGTNYDQRASTNVRITAAIVEAVRRRELVGTPGMNQP